MTAPWTQAIRRGDGEALARFYDAWFDSLFGLARGISRRDESFCLDVVQDVMIRVVDAIPALADERSVAAWLTRAVHSAVVDALRREARGRQRERSVARTTPELSECDPVDHAQDREEQAWLRAAVASLPEADRRLVELRFQGGLTLAEVGQQLGTTGDAAHGRLRRVVARLRRAAEEWFHG